MSPRHDTGSPLTAALALAALVLIALLVACSGSTSVADQDTSSAESAERTGSPDAEAPLPDAPGPDEDGGRDSDEPRLVPPLELPATAPGSDQAAAELIAELDRFLTDEQRRAGVPWPDLRNPDPVAVYRSCAEFQQWMSQHNPTPSLVEAYTAPASPERTFDLDMFDFLSGLDLRGAPADPPYSMRVDELVHPAATGISDALLAQVPEGSAAVVYWDSVGPSDTFTADGQYWGSDPGWTDLGPWVAIMAPTEVGWQVWWDELTEPPPPGSRQNLGPPQEDIPRTDL